MRVLHLITRLVVGGAQENTLASVLGLRLDPGVEVHLASGPTTGPEGSLEPAAREIPGLLTIVPSLVRPVHPWHDGRALFSLMGLIRTRRPDIVHTHSGKAGILGRLAARAAGVPLIVHTIHGPSFGPFQGRAANAAFRAAERFAARFTSHFVVVADAMTRQYLDAGIGRPGQFTRIFSGFDLEPYLAVGNPAAVRARLGLISGDFVVGKIARLFALKGHEDLIAAAAGLVHELPRIRFLLVGDGSWRERIEADISRRGLAGHFIFTGLVPPSSIPELVGAMDVLVHLSRREGLARALPQALAGGRPVIAYDLDGAGEVCLEGRTGYLVPPGDLTALGRQIRRLAGDPQLCRQLGEQGRALAREWFPVERMVQQLRDLYERLWASREAPESLAVPRTPESVP